MPEEDVPLDTPEVPEERRTDDKVPSPLWFSGVEERLDAVGLSLCPPGLPLPTEPLPPIVLPRGV